MLVGVICGILSGALWGLSFVIPKYLISIPSEWIAFGRFTFFGLSSATILLINFKKQTFAEIWRLKWSFLLLALAGYSFYFVLLVMALKWIGVMIPSLIVGLLPFTTALWGQEEGQRNLPFSRLALPVTLILIGIILAQAAQSLTDMGLYLSVKTALGWVFSIIALLVWTYYAITNSREIKRNSTLTTSEWTSATGLGTLVTSLFLLPLFCLLSRQSVPEAWEMVSQSEQFAHWVMGSVILGVGASWLAIWMWNITSSRLSAQLSGQLIVSETVFAVIYGLILEGRYPTILEVLALFSCVAGVSLAIKRFQTAS